MTATADNTARTQAVDAKATAERTVFGILIAISVAHGLNDIVQSLIPAIYPLLKDEFRLDFGQIGIITLAFQLTACLLQPMIGLYTDKRPLPLLAGGRHGLHAGGIADARLRDELPHAAGRRGAGGHRARRSSIPNPRAWRAWPRAGGTGSRSRSSRSAAMWVAPGPYSPPSSSCRMGRRASPGSRSWRSWAWSSWAGSAHGTKRHRRAVARARAGARGARFRRCPARRSCAPSRSWRR